MSDSAAIRDDLRQMVAVLQAERQALAGLDLDGILGAAMDKRDLCGRLDQAAVAEVDEECRGLLDAAKRLNEVNRQVRNLIAAMLGSPALYRAGAGRRPAYAYAGARG